MQPRARFLLILSFLVAAPVAASCGGQTSGTSSADAGNPGPMGTSSSDSGSTSMTMTDSGFSTSDTGSTPPVEGGPGGCPFPVPMCSTCAGTMMEVCQGGSWTCPEPVCVTPIDAAVTCSSMGLSTHAAVSLSVMGVDLGDKTPTDWESIGLNLDAQCTTATSTNVCTLQQGAPASIQVDGNNGIDNSFGANICPLFDAIIGAGACSTMVSGATIVTDATGAGMVSVGLGAFAITVPIHDAYVDVTSSSGEGVMGAVIDVTDLINAIQSAVAIVSPSLCSGSTFQSIAEQIEQAADILPSGADTQGQPCTAISVGMRWTSATSFVGTLTPTPNLCADGG
jgi:hypothetical protein